MNLIEQIPLIGPILAVAIPFILVLSVIVFVHEYGHYIVGRWCGVRADAFSIGFGPEIAGWTDKRGTRWKVSWIPLGGYVKFFGDVDAASAGTDAEAARTLTPEERRATLFGAPLWARTLTVLAGPVANFLFAIVVFAAIAMTYGAGGGGRVVSKVAEDSAAAEFGFEPGDEITTVDGQAVETMGAALGLLHSAEGRDVDVEILRGDMALMLSGRALYPARLGYVQASGPAACLKSGDVITAVDGASIETFQHLRDAVVASDGRSLLVEAQRGDAEVAYNIQPGMREIRDETGAIVRKYLIGVTAFPDFGLSAAREVQGPVDAVRIGALNVYINISNTLGMVRDLFIGVGDAGQLGGPVGIAALTGEAAKAGFERILMLTAVLSVAIGLFNLFPIPVLDGGHLLFYGIEAIRGKPLSERAQSAVFFVGFVLILTLLAFVTYQDVMRVGGGPECLSVQTEG